MFTTDVWQDQAYDTAPEAEVQRHIRQEDQQRTDVVVQQIREKDKAKELGMTPKAYFKTFTYVSQDPKDQLLLSPAYVTPVVLKKAGLKLSDVSVLEYHEAFAGQILANLKALESDKFCQEHMGLKEKVGTFDMDKFNKWGGSLSIGHPFGATGVRLAMHASNRMIKEDGQFAMIAGKSRRLTKIKF